MPLSEPPPPARSNSDTEELYEVFLKVVTGLSPKFPYGFFEGDHGKRRLQAIVRLAITRYAGIDPADVPHELSYKTLCELRLTGPLSSVCGQSPYGAAQLAWPGRFHPWEFKHSPQRLWSGPQGRENARNAIRWLFDEKLGISVKRIPTVRLHAAFESNGLLGLLVAYDGSAVDAVVDAYPGKFSRSDFNGGIAWSTTEGRIEAIRLVRALIHNRGIGEHELATRVNKKLFKNAGLASMLVHVFDGSPWQAIEAAYPGRVQEWQMLNLRHKWSGERGVANAISATKWLVEEHLKIDPKQAAAKVSKRDFMEAGLAGLLAHCPEINGSHTEAIQLAYPGYFEVWDFAYTRRGTYQGEEGRQQACRATRSLIQDKLGIALAEVPQIVTQRVFTQYGLSGMLGTVYRGSPAQACVDAYPGQFKLWEFKGQRGLWNGRDGLKLAREATRWLIEEKLGLSKDEVPEQLRVQHFYDHGVAGVLETCPVTRGSIFKACTLAYPTAGYLKKQFRGLYIETHLGNCLEKLVLELLQASGKAEGIDFNYNRLYAGCNHRRKCKPDFMLRTSGSWQDVWAECKLHWRTYYASLSRRYLEHCGKLLVFYLGDTEPYPEERVDFIEVRERFAELLDSVEHRHLAAELNEIANGQIPRRFDTADEPGTRMESRWFRADREFLRKNAHKHTAADLSRKLGKTRSAVYSMCRRLGVKPRAGGFWNEARDDYLAKQFREFGNRVLAEHLGAPCTDKMVTQRLIKLGLRRKRK